MKCASLIKETELRKLQDQRILIQFDDSDFLDKQIHELTQICSAKIFECEKNVKRLQTVAQS